jgi:hypothetical protein
MKSPLVPILALACAGLSPLVGEEVGTAKAYQPRVSHEQLAKRLAASKNPLSSTKAVKPVEADSIKKRDRTVVEGGLLARSSILAYGGHWTIVPKGAVLHTPPAYKARVTSKPSGSLLPWQDFFARNRGWIHAQSIKISDARGESVLSEDVLENHKRLGRVVVAVLHNGPISVKPRPVEPAMDAKTSSPEAK